jgi:transcriptional regulator with XRE-family HTH domain
MYMNTLAERLKFSMQSATPKKVKGVELAAAVGVKPPSVSDWLSGKSKTMEGENLLRAAKFLGVNPMWLANGSGEVRPVKDTASSEHDLQSTELKKLIEKLSALEAANKLPPELVAMLQNTLNTVVNIQDNQDKMAAGQDPAMKKPA